MTKKRAALRQRKRINPVGRRGRQDRDELDAVRPTVEARSHGWCEVDGCNRRAVHLHHIGQRSLTFGPERNSPGNLLHVCGGCHRHIHDDEGWARTMGYLR